MIIVQYDDQRQIFLLISKDKLEHTQTHPEFSVAQYSVTTFRYYSHSLSLSPAEGQQLPSILPGSGQTHLLPAVLRCQVPARQQIDPHGPQAGEHSLRRLRLHPDL